MRKSFALVLASGLLVCFSLLGQSDHMVEVCGLTDCPFVDSSVMGGIRYEDYKVTNPAAVQFDPSQRAKSLTALGQSTENTLCEAPAAFTTPAPTITFNSSNVVGQIYWVPVGPVDNAPFEFMDVQISNFTASNGFSNPAFGFRMIRQFAPDGSEAPAYQIQVQAGNAGLGNIPGLPSGAGIGFHIDPTAKSVTVVGTVPTSAQLRQAVLGVFLNAQSILQAAKFTVTTPAPAGYTLWSGTELASLAGQAEPWIEAATNPIIALGPPYSCPSTYSNGYGVCAGQSEIDAFANMLMTQGGEYLGLRTQNSFNILVSNLRTWAAANAPAVDPVYNTLNGNNTSFLQAREEVAIALITLWPTLSADPALSSADRLLISNWMENWLVPPAPVPDYYPNDLGYWSDEVLMADAIRRSDNATFAFGVQRFYGALSQMRTDGSFPLAAQLSACSAVYSDTDLIELVTIAEMAATQGYDLYSMSVGGKSLETAIEFLLDAYQNPALLYQYSKAAGGICFEGNPGDPPNFDGIFSNPGGDINWIEPYIARFPFSTTAARLRAIVGSNISAQPFPLMNNRSGLNTTCAFRTSFEFNPVSGANVTIVSGNNQTVGGSQPVPSPLTVNVTDNTGKPVAGTLVSFAVVAGSANIVAPSQVLTDTTGTASANVIMGPASGPVTVTAKALGVAATFSLTNPGPSITNSGVVGVGGSVPAVTTITPGSLFSIYGQNFVPAGTGRRVYASEIINGMLPTNLLGVCVTVGGLNAPLLDVYPEQINAVAPNAYAGAQSPNLPIGSTEVSVTTGCGTSSAVQSIPQIVPVTPTSPEFLYFQLSGDGNNPVAAINALTGAYVGPAALGPAFAPARPGDLVTIFGSGFGPTNPAITPGAYATGATPVTSGYSVMLGSAILSPGDILYVGAAPGEPIYQLNIRIPAGTPAGNLPLQIQVAGASSPSGAFLAIATP